MGGQGVIKTMIATRRRDGKCGILYRPCFNGSVNCDKTKKIVGLAYFSVIPSLDIDFHDLGIRVY